MNKRVYVITEAFRCFCEPEWEDIERQSTIIRGIIMVQGYKGYILKGAL